MDMYEEMFAEFKLKKERVVCFTTDGGSNIECAVNMFLGNNRRIYCMAHKLNLIVDGALTNCSTFSGLAGKVKCIVKYFKQSINASDALRSEQAANGKKEGNILMLIQSVNTRWNSCLDMLERFVLLSAPVAKILSSMSQTKNIPDILTTSELNILKDFIALLNPFKQVTTEISGENYVTSSLTIPLSFLLLKETEQCESNTVTGSDVKKFLIEGIKRRLEPLEKETILAKATILDPRFKKVYFQSNLSVATAMTELSKEFKEKCKEKNVVPESEISPIEQSSNFPSLWNRHEKLMKNNTTECISTAALPTQLKQYLEEPNIPRTSNPLSFWKDRACVTPVLSELAQKYLTPCASSVPSERVASAVNIIVPDNRSRLTGEHINQRVFLKTVPEKYWYC